MNLRMPIGEQNFKEVREHYYLVDKTDFIRQLIDGHAKVTLMTRPRRFGKTLTMSMLDYFFNLEKKDLHLFEGLAIDRAGPSYMVQQGSRPVIFLSLKNLDSMHWADMYDLFIHTVQEEYQHHSYLMESEKLQTEDRAYFARVLSLSATRAEYQLSLYQLCRFLAQHYQKKPLVLIDEYDAPLQHAYTHGFYKEATTYFRAWFNSGLKDNDFLDFAILTGVLRIAKESIFSGLNNLEVCTVTSHKYDDIFGFTEEEVSRMARELGHADTLPEIRKWYDGYTMGHAAIYNPWSVISYFNNACQAMPYWVNTSANEILHQLLPHGDSVRGQLLKDLLDGHTIHTTLNESVIYQDIGKDKSALFTLLLTTGYLTIAKSLPSSYNRYALRIPNDEVRLVYSMEILNHLVDGIDRDTFDTLFDALFGGKAVAFEHVLEDILLHMASAFDTAGKEVFYHGLMLGMTALFLGKSYRVISNGESGYGRFDLAICPKDGAMPGVLMEFKAVQSEKELDTKAAEALQQIEDKKYAALFDGEAVQKVWAYGIAFCGKHVRVKSKVENRGQTLNEPVPKTNNLNSEFDPTILVPVFKICAAYVQRGVTKFTDFASKTISAIESAGGKRKDVEPWLRPAWEAVQNFTYTGEKLDTKKLVAMLKFVGACYENGTTNLNAIKDVLRSRYGDEAVDAINSYIEASFSGIQAYFNKETNIESTEEGEPSKITDKSGADLIDYAFNLGGIINEDAAKNLTSAQADAVLKNFNKSDNSTVGSHKKDDTIEEDNSDVVSTKRYEGEYQDLADQWKWEDPERVKQVETENGEPLEEIARRRIEMADENEDKTLKVLNQRTREQAKKEGWSPERLKQELAWNRQMANELRQEELRSL